VCFHVDHGFCRPHISLEYVSPEFYVDQVHLLPAIGVGYERHCLSLPCALIVRVWMVSREEMVGTTRQCTADHGGSVLSRLPAFMDADRRRRGCARWTRVRIARRLEGRR
jgi:hypothetical protein